MRYVATFYPLQSRLEPTHCIQAGCQGVSGGRHGGSLIVAVIYFACSLGNLPSFYLFRVVPWNASDTFVGSATIGPSIDNGTSLIADDTILLLPVDSLLHFDIKQHAQPSTEHPFLKPISTFVQHRYNTPRPTVSSSSRASESGLMYIDLGPFQHTEKAGLVFHWVKGALTIFIPGILLTFFNIRLIQALRQSERIRHSSSTSSTSSSSTTAIAGKHLFMLICRPKHALICTHDYSILRPFRLSNG